MPKRQHWNPKRLLAFLPAYGLIHDFFAVKNLCLPPRNKHSNPRGTLCSIRARQDRIPLVDDAEDTVVLMEVDANIKRPALIVSHSTKSILCASEAQNDRRARLQKAFMSPDP
jgi:hypothetical protein